MDCEKFDSLLIDELYDELDELTSAAMKRHASECASCAEKLGGLRATRTLASLQEPSFPAGLEERILASSRDMQVVVPIARGRLSRAVSLAGTWAMRPQTAMAALFLLMIGSSAVLLRSRQPRESAGLTVTQEGSPSPQATAAEDREFDDKGAAAAHGATPAAVVAAQGDRATKSASADEPAPPASLGLARAEAKRERTDPQQGALGGAAAGPGLAPAAAPASPSMAAESRDAVEGDAFSVGMAAYRARRYAEATQRLDEAAAQGNAQAGLWAARSVRDGSGCGAALSRFDAVAARGGPIGNDATFDAARCHEAVGDHEGARARYRSLLGVPAYAARAQAALDSPTELASRKSTAPPAAAAATGGSREVPSKAAAPKPTPAKPPGTNASSF